MLSSEDLERAREYVRKPADDLLELRRLAVEGQQWVEKLLVELERVRGEEGGHLGQLIREAIEDELLTKTKDRVRLSEETVMSSLAVHVLPSGVIVDVRLKLGKVQ